MRADVAGGVIGRSPAWCAAAPGESIRQPPPRGTAVRPVLLELLPELLPELDEPAELAGGDDVVVLRGTALEPDDDPDALAGLDSSGPPLPRLDRGWAVEPEAPDPRV